MHNSVNYLNKNPVFSKYVAYNVMLNPILICSSPIRAPSDTLALVENLFSANTLYVHAISRFFSTHVISRSHVYKNTIC